MKLELDINSARNSSLDNYSDNHNSSEEVKKLLRSGINLAKEGNRPEARQMLLKATEAEPNNETAWLWLASISEYPEELLVFLQNVLKINPENERALEWAKQTKTLLSKTFVQRGINASRDSQKEFAKQCFLQGIVHDSENEMAWLWLASTSDSQDEKVSHLQKVLQINPDNETALSSLNAVRSQMSQTLLRKANSAAISGDHENARQMLETIMRHTPTLEEAWILKAFLTNEYYEKIECYQKALELNPENEAAQAGLASLQALAAKAVKNTPEPPKPVVSEETPVVEAVAPTIEEVAPVIEETVSAVEETQPEVLEQAEESHNILEEFEFPSPELPNEVLAEEFEQPTQQVENPQVFAQETPSEESLVESSAAEVTSYEPVVEEPQAVVENEFAAEDNQPQMQVESQVEEWAESFDQQPQPQAEFFVSEPQQVQVEEVVEEVQPQVEQTTFVEPQAETVSFVQEELFAAEENEVEAESSDSPTQELDEEYIRTAEAAFSSFEQPETLEEEVKESLSELQAEPQVFEQAEPQVFESEVAETVNQFVEEEKAVEEVQAEQNQSSELSEPETVLAEEAPEEVFQPEEIEEATPTLYTSPYFANNGFEMVSTNEPFADHQQPTVEFSYSEVAEVSAPSVEEVKPSFEAQQVEEPVQEFVPAQINESLPVHIFEHQTEQPANGFSHPQEEVVEKTVEEVQPQIEEPVEEVQAQVEEPVKEVQAETVSQPEVQVQLIQCPFCEFENEAQTVICHSCQAMLSLSDLEMLLAHQGANQDLLLAAIEKMEVEKTLREFSVEELMNLGVAHLNAKNLRKGFSYFQEASQINPNDVVLGSKVNFLAIRLSEIEQHDHKVQENPVQSRTIMVVDDSPTVRKLISGKLEKSGHSVISAIDGMDALAKINEVIPDLILLDITMPRLDGYQVCKLIRNNEITKDIPIVMISGKDGFFDKVRGRMAGSSGYITKPFGPDTLMKTLETYLS